jgi:tRNA A37 threonylcarbamoyladenosine dehydratase
MNQARSEILIGTQGIQKLKDSSVAIIGLGGVGSFAAEAVARSGVGKILVMDADKVESSNLNRQLYALHSTLNQPKSELAKARILDINPDCEVKAVQDFLTEETEPQYLEYDLVIDCIDSFSSKFFLIKNLLNHQKPFIASMGAGGKIDPSRVELSHLNKTTICPLAKKMRQMIRKEGLSDRFPVVYSTEPPVKPENGALASMIFVPAVFGLTLAGWACRKLIGSSEF